MTKRWGPGCVGGRGEGECAFIYNTINPRILLFSTFSPHTILSTTHHHLHTCIFASTSLSCTHGGGEPANHVILSTNKVEYHGSAPVVARSPPVDASS